jgi:hypothetical protein
VFVKSAARILIIVSLVLTFVSLLLSSYATYKMKRLASATRPQARLIATDAVAR